MGDKVKILVCGDVEGKFDSLFSKISNINKKSGPFEFLLSVGNFFGVNNKEFEPYKNGFKQVPIPLYILGPNKEEHVPLYPKDESELCNNVFYLGKRGVFNSSGGLKIAYLSGLAVETKDATDYQYTTDDAIALRDACLKGNPGFKGVDILITSQWPEGVTNNDKKNTVKLLNSSATYQPSWLALQLRPRYHISGLEGVFYERPPYRNQTSGDIDTVTRFLGLARVANVAKEKWIYALNLMPLSKIKISDLLQKTTDETQCPYYVLDIDAKIYKKKRKPEDNQQFFYDMSGKDERNQNRGKGKKQRVEFDQSKCWFCLSSPSVEKHLVVTVGESIYIAAAKGGLVDEHLLICPVEHHQSMISLPNDIVDEIERFKDAIRKFYDRSDKCAVFFERNYKTSHMQIQAVPLPKATMKEIKEIFKEEAEGNGVELQELESHSRLDQVIKKGVPYFTIDLPSKETLYGTIQASKGFPINFARDVLVMGPLLNTPDRAEWKDCILPKDEEERLVAKLRTDFEPFDINDD